MRIEQEVRVEIFVDARSKEQPYNFDNEVSKFVKPLWYSGSTVPYGGTDPGPIPGGGFFGPRASH